MTYIYTDKAAVTTNMLITIDTVCVSKSVIITHQKPTTPLHVFLYVWTNILYK